MSSRIPDLWSDQISSDVLTPLVILRAQIPGLQRRTKGVVESEINSVIKAKSVIHNFDLMAPALGTRERILIVTHDRDRVYPVTLEAAYFARKHGSVEMTAMYEEEFISLVAEVLSSPDVLSAIQSLVARSNEISSSALSDDEADSTTGAAEELSPLPQSKMEG